MGKHAVPEPAITSDITIAQAQLYINNLYHAFIIDHFGFYKIANSIVDGVQSGRFIPHKFIPITEIPSTMDDLAFYTITFKPTTQLYKLINWDSRIIPTYVNMMNANDVANVDIAQVARNIVIDTLKKHALQGATSHDTLLYDIIIQQFLQFKIFITSDIINRKFHLIIKK